MWLGRCYSYEYSTWLAPNLLILIFRSLGYSRINTATYYQLNKAHKKKRARGLSSSSTTKSYQPKGF